METKLQSHRCSELGRSFAHQEVRLAGWILEKRDLGNLIFLVLRDDSGCVQLFLEKKCNPVLYEQLALLTKSSALAVKGVLLEREGQALSQRAATPQDEVEVQVQSIECMHVAAPIPLLLTQESRQETALRYRYLELRQGPLLGHLKKRAQILSSIRSYLEALHFIEVETPILTAQTPEGARDYLVPSRLHWGRWYALPQSPQLFKQLLVIGGLPRYYQIARCFRDEDLRQDRQPEFTQLDCEASFVRAEEVQLWIEGLVRKLLKRFCGVDLPAFPRLSFDEAFENYGSDKPDLRWPEKLVEMADWICPSSVRPSSPSKSQKGWSAWGLKIPKGALKSRSAGEALQSEWEAKGWKRPLWIRQSESGQLQGLPKWLNDVKAQQGLERFKLQAGEGLWWVQGPRRSTLAQLGQLRARWIQSLPHPENTFCPVWVTDFPMFDPFDAEEGRLTPMHHPFTQPQGFENFEGENLDSIDAFALRAEAYDLVINGYEVGGGSTRIANPSLQRWVFEKCGLSAEEQETQFGFLLEALSFGAPPHSGIALGLDRLVMLILGLQKIREVIAFPKTATASCPLTGAPKLPAPGALEALGMGSLFKT